MASSNKKECRDKYMDNWLRFKVLSPFITEITLKRADPDQRWKTEEHIYRKYIKKILKKVSQ